MTYPGKTSATSLSILGVIAVLVLSCHATNVAAQDSPRSFVAPVRVDAYRHALSVDVPPSAALLMLGIDFAHRGSAPKPVQLSAGLSGGGESHSYLAADIVPYWLVGPSSRDLQRFRSNSVRGRLTRVLMKTSLGVGLLDPANDHPGSKVSFALRATFHDPHDPVLNSTLPEDAAKDNPETLDLPTAGLLARYARARTQMRARGGVQISGGHGVSVTARSSSIDRDSLGAVRHRTWMAGQVTLGPRIDLVLAGQVRSARVAHPEQVLALGFLRKSHHADVAVQLDYECQQHRFLGLLQVDAQAIRRLNIVAGLGVTSDTLKEEGSNALFRASLAPVWFAAGDHP